MKLQVFNTKGKSTITGIDDHPLEHLRSFNPSVKMIAAIDQQSNSIFDDDQINHGEVNLRQGISSHRGMFALNSVNKGSHDSLSINK